LEKLKKIDGEVSTAAAGESELVGLGPIIESLVRIQAESILFGKEIQEEEKKLLSQSEDQRTLEEVQILYENLQKQR
jgi:hypothetical protein